MQTFRYGWVQGLEPHQIIRTQFSPSFSSVLTSFSRRCSPYGSSQQLQASIFFILIARNICKSLSFPIIPLKIPGSNCIPVAELTNQCHQQMENDWPCLGHMQISGPAGGGQSHRTIETGSGVVTRRRGRSLGYAQAINVHYLSFLFFFFFCSFLET